MQGDYSLYIPFVVRALVGKDLLHNLPHPLRLYGKREALKAALLETIAKDNRAIEKIMSTLSMPPEMKV
jgi:formiminotetrahydrofolate cyclodeaminase